MAEIRALCSKCGKSVNMVVNQVVDGTDIYWNSAVNCLSCGLNMEEDGTEDISDINRNAILDQEGKWGLVLISIDKKIETMKLLKQILKLNMNEIKNIQMQANKHLLEGTRQEMERLQNFLIKENIETRVKQL